MNRNSVVGGACLTAAAAAVTVFGTAGPASADLPNGNTTNDWGNNDLVGCGGDTSGGYVVAVQDFFWGAGYPVTAIDGQYGPNTLNAIKFFQGIEGLTADGCAGPATWRRMQGSLSYITNPDSGAFFIQTGSTRLGFFLAPAFSGCDGIWATSTATGPRPPIASPLAAGKDYKFSRTLTTSGC